MLWLIFLYAIVSVRADYEVPAAKIEALYPKGFRVSIPDEEGIKLFAFHAKLNEELNGREGGTFSRDITKAKNGRWTFYEPYTKLKVGDTLYYWTYVDYFDGRNKLGYTNDDQVFVVKELLDESKPVTEVVYKIPGQACESTDTVTNSGQVCKGDLIFSDNFDNDLNNNKHWKVEQRYADAPDYEFVIYMNRKENLNVGNGILKIKPILSEQVLGSGFVTSHAGYDFKEACTGVVESPSCKRHYDAGFILPPVVSAQLTSKHNFTFKYGKIEIRAKLPKGDWIYPQLYLNPLNEEYGRHYESGQIRIAFSPGNSHLNNVLQGGVILGSGAGRTYGLKSIDRRTPWSDDFHNFELVWKPSSISVSVDGIMYGNIYPPSSGFSSLGQYLNVDYADRWKTGPKLAPFDKDMPGKTLNSQAQQMVLNLLEYFEQEKRNGGPLISVSAVQEMYLTIGVGVGGFNFEDKNDGNKPWKNSDRLIMKNFYSKKSQWESTWNDHSSLEVDYIKVWAL